MSKEKTGGNARPSRYNKRFKLSGESSASALHVSIEQSENLSNHVNNEEFQSNQFDFDCSKDSEEVQNVLTSNDNDTVLIETLLKEIRENHEDDIITENYEDATSSDPEDFLGEENDECFSSAEIDESDILSAKDPIYSGHSMTVGTSMLLILLYTITHSISGVQLNDLLTLVGLHCMEIHPGLKSLFTFKKYFANMKSPMVKHHYCLNCLTQVEEEAVICPNKFCNKSLADSKTKGYFIEIPIEKQLQSLFKRADFPELLKHNFTREKQKPHCVEDIYDGEIYKKLVEKGLLSAENPYNISFTLNTDGVPVFKSSNFSIWPVFLMINELPFKYRRQSENMLFCGLWFGESKPFMATFSRPIQDSLKNLEVTGIDVSIRDKVVNVKAFLICCTADLPAKSLLLNMNQFNGAHSCHMCTQKGETFKTTKGGSVHIFQLDKDTPFGPKRTKKECIENAIEAMNTKKPVCGIKGPSFLLSLKHYDFVQGTSIDYMHGVLLGVTKLMIKLWISSPFGKEDFSIASHSDLIDKRLLDIKPPSFITRSPRSISSHFKHWKASELRSWLFYYSLPILHDILSECYFLHYAAFVEAVHTLCGSSISISSIERSQRLLTYFVMTFKDLYGERYQTLNLHLLLHLPQCVRNLGPLWVYSCFSFETANGDIMKLFHGTQHVELQISSAVNIIQNIPALIASAPCNYETTIRKMYPGKQNKQINNFHLQFLGKGYNKVLSDEIMQQVFIVIDKEPPNLTFYNRIFLRGDLYHSKEYLRAKKRNNCTVKYFNKFSKMMEYGSVNFFGTHNDGKVTFAFINRFDNVGSITEVVELSNILGIKVPHVSLCKQTCNTVVVDINSLISVCANICLPQSNILYIGEPPNCMETD